MVALQRKERKFSPFFPRRISGAPRLPGAFPTTPTGSATSLFASCILPPHPTQVRVRMYVCSGAFFMTRVDAHSNCSPSGKNWRSQERNRGIIHLSSPRLKSIATGLSLSHEKLLITDLCQLWLIIRFYHDFNCDDFSVYFCFMSFKRLKKIWDIFFFFWSFQTATLNLRIRTW